MKVCFVSILGRPNVGKSTLLNHILNYDLSIVSNKPQTTRNQINGILNEEDYQIVFIDTPGIHKSQHKLGENLNKMSYESLEGVDVILFLSPADENIGKGDSMIIERLQNFKNKIALITKVDLSIERSKLDDKAQELKSLGFEKVLGTSFEYPNTIESLINEIKTYAYDNEPFYDVEQVTDKSMRFIAKEIIRESAINLLKEEVPHSIAVIIESFNEYEELPYEIEATIYVARESQKGIVIGKGGEMIKKIGLTSRIKLAKQFDHKIILKTKVKVNKNWVNQEKEIRKMGY